MDPLRAHRMEGKAADHLAFCSSLMDVQIMSYDFGMEGLLLKFLLSHSVFFRKGIQHPSRHSRGVWEVPPLSQALS